jgi:hypothetical protein
MLLGRWECYQIYPGQYGPEFPLIPTPNLNERRPETACDDS